MPDPQSAFPGLAKAADLAEAVRRDFERTAEDIKHNGIQIGEEAKKIPLGNTDRDDTASRGGLKVHALDPFGTRELRAKDTSLTVHRYPEEVGNEEDPNYVMFFVNIPESRLEQSGGQGNARAYYDPTKNNANRMKFGPDDNTLVYAGGSLGALAGTMKAAEAVQSARRGEGVRALGAIGGALTTGAAGIVVGATAGGALNAAIRHQRFVQLKECIALHIQSKPASEYAAEWSDQEMGMLGSINQNKDLATMAKYILREGALKASMIPKLAGLGYDFRSFVEKAEQRVPNPHKEQLFRSMGLRKFGFEYTFMPKSRSEFDQVQRIIKTFKKYMHPTVDPSKYFLSYPAEFNIIYYHGEVENQHIHKITSCALTNMKVEYGGTEMMTFKDSAGAPTEIFMSLTFNEMEMLTAERVEQGF